MVKLRVAARVIPENDYNDVQSTPGAGRKFLVIVKNPDDWQVGTLAVEIQNTYKRIYKHDLGKVKYLKDVDDFDLDPEQNVSDIFVNEGKAYRDGLDQEAVIKVVQEQGQAVRYGSVVPDLTPVQYQKKPLPPVPRFSEVPTTLGKRSHDFANGRIVSDYRYGDKRFRQAEIPETQSGDEVIPSVERSPELIEDTQASPIRRTNIKFESPEFRRAYRDVIPATEDELQFLPGAPTNFPNNRKYLIGGEHVTPRGNGISQNQAGRSSGTYQHTQLPITPGTNVLTNGRRHGSRSPATGALSSGKKFKDMRPSTYDLPESDIEDSQMSPHAPPTAGSRLTKNMSTIEDMPSQEQSSYDFNARTALDPMELDDDAAATRDFIAEKRHSVTHHNDFSHLPVKPPPKTDAVADTMEMPATAIDPKPSKDSQDTVVEPSQTAKSKKKKEKQTKTTLTELKKDLKDDEARPKSSSTKNSKNEAASNDVSSVLTEKEIKKKAKNHRKKDKKMQVRRESQGEDNTDPQKNDAANDNAAITSTETNRNIFEELKQRRRSSDLDSPGEQLSQSLQESARKKSFSSAEPRLANFESNETGRPSNSSSGSTSTSTPASRRTSSGTTNSSGSVEKLGLGITSSPRGEKDKKSVKHDQQEEKPAQSLPEKLQEAKDDAKAEKKKVKSADVIDAATRISALSSVDKSAFKGEESDDFDFEKQCGVMQPSGQLCPKPLGRTCHAKYLQRAVVGRNKPLDAILKEMKTSSESPAPVGKAKIPSPDKTTPQTTSTDQDKLPKSSGKKDLPNWSSSQADTTIMQASTPLSEITPSTKAKHPIVLPQGMTQAEYDAMMNKSAVEKPKDKKKNRKSSNEAATSTPIPEVKVTPVAKNKTDSSSSDSGSSGSSSEDEKVASKKKSKDKNLSSKFEPEKKESDETKTSEPSSKPSKSEKKDKKKKKDVPTVEPPSTTKSSKTTPGKSETAADRATPQTAKVTSKPDIPKVDATALSKKKATTTDSAPKLTSLQKMRLDLAEKLKDTSVSSPASTKKPDKKVFVDSSSDSSSSESSSDSDSDSSDDQKKKKKSAKKSKSKEKKGMSAIPDPSTRDQTDDEGSSDED